MNFRKGLLLGITLSVLLTGFSFSQDVFATIPTVDAGPDAIIDEGDTFSSSGSFVDPDADTWTATVDYGDGSGVQPLTLNPDKTFALDHVYTMDETYTVIVEISDGTDSVIDEVTVTVNNVLPTVDVGLDVTINEGDTFSYAGSFTDPGDDPWEATVDYDDDNSVVAGEAQIEELPLVGQTFVLNHVYEQDGIYLVDVIVDDFSNPDVNAELVPTQVQVTVDNVAPILDSISDATISEGDTYSATGSFTDPGNDSWTLSVDYGDGTALETPAVAPDRTFQLEHLYDNEGVFTVTVSLNDGTVVVEQMFEVTVDNVAPAIETIFDATINEGDTFTTTGAFTDPSSDVLSATVDYGDGSGVQPLTLNPDSTFDLSHTYEDNSVNTVTITIDDTTTTSQVTFDVTVDNVSPTVTVGTTSVDETRTYSATGSFTDPGSDSWTATVDYDDGIGPQSLVLNPDNSFSLSNTYSTNGAYSVTVTVTDDDSGVGISSFTVGVFISEGGPAAGLTSPPSVTTTLNQGATFQTNNQDIWGPVNSGSSSWELFPTQTWNERSNKNSYVSLAGKSFGVGVDVGTSGHFGLISTAEQLQGTTDVIYPGDIELGYLDDNTFLAGESVPITSNWNLDTTGATINAGETQGDLTLALDLRLNSFYNNNFCFLGGCETLSIPGANFDVDQTIFSFKVADPVPAPPPLIAQHFGSATFSPISVTPDNVSVNGATGEITASGSNTFSTMQMDIDKIAGDLPPYPPIAANFGGAVTKGPGFVSYDTFDANENVDYIAQQTLTFDGDVLIKLEFSRPVAGVLGSFQSATTDGAGLVTSVIYKSGDEIQVAFPEGETEPIIVTPTIFLDPTNTKLHNFAKIITESDVTMLAGKITAGVNGFTVVPGVPPFDWTHYHWECHGFLCSGGHFHGHTHTFGGISAVEFDGTSFTLGPIWTSGPQGQVSSEEVIANKAFDLGGFNTVQLPSFELDPEVPPTAVIGGPYVVNEGSTILVDGSGSFDVDLPAQTLTHTWDLNNDASFETSGESVDFVFGIDGPATHPISIQVCDDYNCDIDSGMVDVLNVDPTVDVGLDDSVDEGTLYTRTASFEDPGADEWIATVDYGDGSGVQPLALNADKSFDLSHTFADNGIYTVTVVVTDDDAGVGTDSFNVTVNNVNPTVEAGADQETVIHDTVNLDPATYSDPGFDCGVCATLEDFTAIVNWGEFSDEPLTITETPGSVGVLTTGTASGSHIYRLPGDYTVTVTVDDDDSGSTTDTLVTTVLGAQDLKNRANSFLTPYDDEKKVEKAIDAINDSLDSKFWINDVYLDEKHGKKVFDEEKKAVKELQKLLKDGAKKGIDPVLEQAAQDSIDLLVNADRVLAITIMLDASSTPADDPKKQKKVDEENEKSAEEFVKADQKRDDGDYDKAIDHYKKAWEHAHHALKHAAK